MRTGQQLASKGNVVARHGVAAPPTAGRPGLARLAVRVARQLSIFAAPMLVSLLVSSACSSGDSGSSQTKTCVPGESRACTGAAACSGFQTCAQDGASFGACMCGGTDGSAGNAGAAGDSGAGGSSGGTGGVGGSSGEDGGLLDASADGAPDAPLFDGSMDAVQDSVTPPFDAPGDVGKSPCGQCVIQNCAGQLCNPSSNPLCQACIDSPCAPGCSTFFKPLHTCGKIVCQSVCCN